MKPGSSSSESTRKPPKIPESMRTKLPSKPDKNEKNNIPKFPLNLRSSTYDNVVLEEGEDEGIENDYSDDSSGTPGPSLIHETSPAQTSEGYDSAQESGEREMIKPCSEEIFLSIYIIISNLQLIRKIISRKTFGVLPAIIEQIFYQY